MKKTIITPRILKGTRDFGPQTMTQRNFVIQKITNIFQTYGYDTIETPVIEYTDTILGNTAEESTKLTYTFKDNGGRNIALRYDQTVPTARYVAQNYSSLPMPFKRYQISRVWRADKPARGRYREFYQCDIDIIGTDSLLAEAEMIKIIQKVYTTLGLPDIQININSRRLMNSILSALDIPKYIQLDVIRIIDKLDKLTQDEICSSLESIITQKQTKQLFDIITLSGTNSEKIIRLKEYDTSEIVSLFDLCQLSNINTSNIRFCPALARGLDYYTGIIIEVNIPDINIGSVCGGGRYDDLCSRFINKKISGTGVAFGFDRTIIAMEERGLLNNIPLSSKILVTYFDDKTLSYSLNILDQIQKTNINAEIYMEPTKLSTQLKYANKKQIPYVVIIGPDEMKNEIVILKNMKTGEQKIISNIKLLNYLKNI